MSKMALKQRALVVTLQEYSNGWALIAIRRPHSTAMQSKIDTRDTSRTSERNGRNGLELSKCDCFGFAFKINDGVWLMR